MLTDDENQMRYEIRFYAADRIVAYFKTTKSITTTGELNFGGEF